MNQFVSRDNYYHVFAFIVIVASGTARTKVGSGKKKVIRWTREPGIKLAGLVHMWVTGDLLVKLSM